MKFNDDFYRRFEGGSTRLGGDNDAKYLAQGGGPIACEGGTIIRFQPQQPSIVFGGAGSGKFANLGAYQLVHPSTNSFFILDIGGQFMSTTWHYNQAMGREAYAINPHGASSHSDINHPVNLFGLLKDDDDLFDSSKAVTGMALTEGEKDGDNAWVLQGAQRWFSRFITSLVRLEGCVKPDKLWQFINTIDTDDEFLKNWGRACENLPNDEYATFLEIHRKKNTSEKEYGAIMGKIKDDLDWLSSPKVAASISGDIDYLSFLGDPKKKVGIYYVIRGGSTKEMLSLTRMVVGIAQLACVRAMKGALPIFYLEEAATCGKAEFIKKAVSEYRKYFTVILVYQSQGQLILLFSEAGAQEIMESCGMQIFLGGGIRDFDSAKKVAEAVGRKTIDVDIPMAQLDRAFRAQSATWQSYWQDMDMMEGVRNYEHETMQSQQHGKKSRYAIDPAELMRLKNEVLILTPGMGLQPILADKLLPYWENSAMAGRYGPDPLFPPLDRVIIHRWFWGKTTRRFIREDVPAHLAHLPNHINGEIAYVQGHRTW